MGYHAAYGVYKLCQLEMFYCPTLHLYCHNVCVLFLGTAQEKAHYLMEAREQKLAQSLSGVTLEGGGSAVEVGGAFASLFFSSPLNQKLVLSEEPPTDMKFLKIRKTYNGDLMKQF